VAVALLGLALAFHNPLWFDNAVESSAATTLVGVAAGLTLAALILVARRQ
jgi:hypothetical protein